MKKHTLHILTALVAVFQLLFAPVVQAANPFDTKKMTIREENEMGRKFDLILRSQMSMVGDTYITDYVADVVNRIVKGKRPMPFRVTSAVIANPMLNAFAIPGGFIYVFTGMIQEVETESELAGVIAHELAHVSQRHVASRLEKQQKISLLSTAGTLAGLLIGVAGGGETAAKAGQALMLGSQGAGTAAMLQYSQDDEREADHVGLNSLVNAGYNPEGMPGTFEIMVKNRWFDSGSQMPSYLSTHPGTTERITYLKDRIARMPKAFLERKDDNTRLHRVQMLVRSRMSPANTALAYWEAKPEAEYTALDWVGKGNAQQRLKKTSDAWESFKKGLDMDSSDPLVAREAGIYLFQAGRQEEAFPLLQMATIKNKRDALGLFFLARLQANLKQFPQAITNMRKVEEIVPEDWEVHHYLGMILGESGDNFGGNLHLGYSSAYSMNLDKARRQYKTASEFAKTPEQKKQLNELKALIKARSEVKE